MSNRCESCERFVSLENGEPEVASDFEIDWNDPERPDAADITGTVTLVRRCAECGADMKTAEYEFEEELNAGFCGEKTWAKMLEYVGHGHELKIEFDDPDVAESGGSRYEKNMITVSVDYAVRCACQEAGAAFLFSSTMEDIAASSFEEC